MAAPRVADPSYEAVHVRLIRELGKASEKECTRCGRQACDWAYDHRDEDEKTDEKGRPYSADTKRYLAMCRKCHRDFDRKPACPKGHEYTEKNTYRRNGIRYCRECRRIYSNWYYHNKAKASR